MNGAFGGEHRDRAAALASKLTDEGDIRDPAWRDVFARVPRHTFVPHFARDDNSPNGTYYTLVSGDDAAQREEWLEAVYSNTTLVTQVEAQPVEQIFAGGGGYGAHSSSSTAPGLMAWMLDELRLDDGMRVVEVGTGSGYNAALLCARLGSAQVTTVDIDTGLAERARDRLASLGYHPMVAVADGRDGYPAGAPYDRVIATCSLPYLPPAWITQTRPGGMILTNITGALGGAMLLASVGDGDVAHGRFLPRWAGFMWARPAGPRLADITALDTEEGTHDTGMTDISPGIMADPAFAFVAQLHTVDARPYWATHEDGRPLYGLIAPDGSWAEVYPTDATGSCYVEQGGPRRLWTLAEEAHSFWTGHGKPDWSRFGVTATSRRQYAWLDYPDGLSWDLPR